MTDSQNEAILYSLINPSDAVTFKAKDMQIAVLVTAMLSQGMYPAEALNAPDDGNSYDVPLFRNGFDEWWEKHWPGTQPNKVIDERLSDFCDCLESFVYGDAEDRLAFEARLAAAETDDERQALWQEQEDGGTSLNRLVWTARENARRQRSWLQSQEVKNHE